MLINSILGNSIKKVDVLASNSTPSPSLPNENEEEIKSQEAQSNCLAQDRYQSFYSNLNHVRLSSGGNTSRSSHYSRHAYDADLYVSQEISMKDAEMYIKDDSIKIPLHHVSNKNKKELFPVKETKSSMQRKRTSRRKIDTSWRIFDSS